MNSMKYLYIANINGLNLFLYCVNNPIMYVDSSGDLPQWVELLIGGALVVGVIALTIATGGVAAGTIWATVHTIATRAMIGGITIAGGISENGVASWNWNGTAEGFMWGSITGVISGAGSNVSAYRWFVYYVWVCRWYD